MFFYQKSSFFDTMKILMKQPWKSFSVVVLVFALAFLFNNIIHTRQLFTSYQKQQNIPILFIPGLGLQTKDYQTLINNLKKDHYQIINYKPADTNTSNYQQLVKEWTKGISKQIGDKKVIVIGHSVGGSVAAYFCSYDTRCVAGINMDGGAAFSNKIRVPFLYLQADTGSYCDQQCYSGRALMENIASQSGSTFIHISGIKHYNFTDLRTQTLRNEDYLCPQDGRKFIYANIHTFLKENVK
jgi:pimeloyl-ACP methyl ester carboxylesterase